MEKLNALRDYIYIEESVVDNFLSQVPDDSKKSKNPIDFKLKMSLIGQELEVTRKGMVASSSLHNKVNKLIIHLFETNQLMHSRPFGEDDPKAEANFFLERMTATKVIFPKERFKSINNLKDFAVWVSDPDTSHFTDEPWKWYGTFLYLTETYWDDNKQMAYSGCSALQAIVNTLNGEELRKINSDESFARKNDEHPLEKLRSIGGIVGVPQKIQSLYRMRYLTDEQSYKVNGEKRRVHDMIGYPIVIARSYVASGT